MARPSEQEKRWQHGAESGSQEGADPYDPQSFDHLAEDYELMASLERSHEFFLSNLPQRRVRVLDVGCGTGLLAFELAQHFESVLGVDCSEPMLAIARSRRSCDRIEYRQLDARHLSLAERFDLITSHTMFHHLTDVGRVLEELKTLLQPGGRLIIVDNVSNWPPVPRFAYRVRFYFHFVQDCFRLGRTTASQLLRMRTSKAWLDHVVSDRYFSPAEFKHVYGTALPQATFTRLRDFMGVVWDAPC